MEGILRRLSAEGSEAENAIRVIAFFDRLVETRAGIEELVRSSARLVGAPAGYLSQAKERNWAFDSRGRQITTEIPGDAVARFVVTDSQTAGIVWIQSFLKNAPLGDLIIERMALSASIILGRESVGATTVELSHLGTLLSKDSSFEDKASSAWRLGFKTDWNIRVFITPVATGLNQAEVALQEWALERKIKCSNPQIEDGFIVALIQDFTVDQSESSEPWDFLAAFGSRVGVFQANDSLETAKQVLHLTSMDLGPKFVDYELLGPLVHISAISPVVAQRTSMVEQLIFLSQSEVGRGELAALDAFCKFHSLRIASTQMHLHHSSLAHRLKNVEKKLNVDLKSPQTYLAVSLALQLYRIAKWN